MSTSHSVSTSVAPNDGGGAAVSKITAEDTRSQLQAIAALNNADAPNVQANHKDLEIETGSSNDSKEKEGKESVADSDRGYFQLLCGPVKPREAKARTTELNPVLARSGNLSELKTKDFDTLWKPNVPDPLPYCHQIRNHKCTWATALKLTLYTFSVFGTGGVGIFLITWALYETGVYSLDGSNAVRTHSLLEAVIITIFVVLLALMMILGVLLIQNTNENSISGMVAQRHNRLSYVTILVIITASAFSSAFILMSAISSNNYYMLYDNANILLDSAHFTIANLTYELALARGQNATPPPPYTPLAREVQQTVAMPYDVQVLLAGISPLLSALILLFPLAVVKRGDDLTAIPLDSQYFEEEVDGAPRDGESRRQALLNATTFRLTFYSGTTRKCHTLLHAFSILSGLILGYISIVWQARTFGNIWEVNTAVPNILYSVVAISGTCLIVFLVLSQIVDGKEFQKLSKKEQGKFKFIRRFIFW